MIRPPSATRRTRTRPPRRDADRTRARLLQAAIRLFAARGYDGVSVDEVVARARVNKRMVYHYFGSKDDLYLAALAQVFTHLETVELDALVSGLPPEEQLRRLLAAYFAFLDEHPEFVRLLLWENLQQGHHIARHPERLSKNPFLERFAAVIDQGVRQGVFRAPVDRRHLAVNLIGLCFIYSSNRYSLSASLGLRVDTAPDRARRLAQALDLVLHGVLAAKARAPRPRKG
jgi:AcrR family transcriptional regulator